MKTEEARNRGVVSFVLDRDQTEDRSIRPGLVRTKPFDPVLGPQFLLNSVFDPVRDRNIFLC